MCVCVCVCVCVSSAGNAVVDIALWRMRSGSGPPHWLVTCRTAESMGGAVHLAGRRPTALIGPYGFFVCFFFQFIFFFWFRQRIVSRVVSSRTSSLFFFSFFFLLSTDAGECLIAFFFRCRQFDSIGGTAV